MKMELEHQGQTITVKAEWIGGKLWYHMNGVTRVFEPAVTSKRQGAGSAREEIVSAMPGKITKVLKGTGDNVKAGEIVLVMEAMKMEYSLKAEVSGKIQSIDCHVGDQVPLGHRLAKIETSNG